MSVHTPDLFSFATPAERSDFDEYHERNPQVWAMFKRFTFEAILSGRSRIGAKMIAERIRWETFLRPAEGDEFKINNNYVAFYARKFMCEFPEHDSVFQTRTSQADAA